MKVDDLIIKYIPLQQGLRLSEFQTRFHIINTIIKYIPLQQGLRQDINAIQSRIMLLLSIFHYNKD